MPAEFAVAHGSTRRRRCPRSPRPACSSATRCARPWSRRWRRDSRVIFYGEDVADYGGAFKASKGLLETFGRDRVFNTPISEAAICGTGVGAAMAGLRPVVELMYMDFALMASDQIANQAGKWHYMSGAQTTVPLVIRASVGRRQGLRRAALAVAGVDLHAHARPGGHLPGHGGRCQGPAEVGHPLRRSGALLREPGPLRGARPDARRSRLPRAHRQGPRRTRGRRRHHRGLGAGRSRTPSTAAETLAGEGIECDVIDLRTLVPLDMETVLASVRKTGRCVVAAQAVLIGSYVNEIVARVVAEAFDDLDAPVARIGRRQRHLAAGRGARGGLPAPRR